MNLDTLGPRICILGPSNSGKSTLADAIAANRAWSPSISTVSIICRIPTGSRVPPGNS